MRLIAAVRAGAVALIFVAGGAVIAAPTSARSGRHAWSTAWFAPAFLVVDTRGWGFEHDYAGYTVRQTIRLGTGGEVLRIKFGNETGEKALKLAAASVILISKGQRPALPVPLTFDGRTEAVIAPGTPRYSDIIRVKVKRFDELAVSVRFERGTPVLPAGHLAQVTIGPGDWVSAPSPPPGASEVTAPSAITAVETRAERAKSVLVAIGDSITEGLKSTTGKYRGWPDIFAERLAGSRKTGWSVINAGISGNRLLSDRAGPNLLARFDRDALALCGASAIVVLIGINDITHGPDADAKAGVRLSADDLVTGYKQLIQRAHFRGLKIYGATILPFLGPQQGAGDSEAIRLDVNRWIRTAAAYDGVIDFDAAMRDPAHRDRMFPAYDSGDHVHPSDNGYARMASIVPLSVASAVPPGPDCRDANP